MPKMKALVCRECGKEYPTKAIHVCEMCFGPLEVKYNYDEIKQAISRKKIAEGPDSMWRYIDLLPVEPIEGVTIFQMDFMDDDAPDKLKEMLGGKADIVMSDMAPNTTGHKQTDHIRIMAVVEAAYYFAQEVLKPEGVFIAKVLQGGAQNELLAQMKKDFKTIRHIKPPASRKESSEQYLVASGFRG